MGWSLIFFVNSALLGVGLAMDAFSVSLANGLNEPKMKTGKMFLIAGVFAFFQALMPLTGWFCVNKLVQYFTVFEKFIPWISLILLSFIGGKMIFDCIKNKDCDCDECRPRLTFAALLVQGVATSIDALSVGFTIATYNFAMALVAALIIAAVTLIICLSGIYIGKHFGNRFSNKSGIIGGIILILIGLEIFITSFI
ncbi:MAG: manganese efflux pump [Oscillospiraceae bacterium]|nr:manganese efflux pump [Oscillospiraceae bacterium]